MHYHTTFSTITDDNMSPRLAGDVQAIQNQIRFIQAAERDTSQTIIMQCNHGVTIREVDSTDCITCPTVLNAEALITTDPKITLGLLTADCIPATFFDPYTNTLALTHLSRVTIAALLPSQLITYLVSNYRVKPHNIVVTLGPHIHADSYRLPLTAETLPSAIMPFTTTHDSSRNIDITAATIAQLTANGMKKTNITIHHADTYTNQKYWSHRLHVVDPTVEAGRLLTLSYLEG